MSRSRTIGFTLTILLTGCSMRKLAADQTADVFLAAKPAIDREPDVELMREALPAQISLITGLLESSPNNEALLLLATQAYSEYAFAFVEDQMETLADSDPERALDLRRRARALYLRGMDYGLRLLEKQDARFPQVFFATGHALEQVVTKLDEDAAPGLFWTGFGLAGAINLGKDEPSLIAMLPKVEVLITRVEKLNPNYHYAGALTVMGAFWASRTKIFGGDPERGRQYFERALKLYPNFLMNQVIYAKTYAVQTQNRDRYMQLLTQVLEAKLDVMPKQRLANELARRRAQRYLSQVDELF